MIVLIVLCFLMWLFMLWLTYSKKLNNPSHLLTLDDGILLVRDTPIARLYGGLSVKITLDDIREIAVTSTHVILSTQKGTVDIFINHRFINELVDYLKQMLGEIDIEDSRPLGNKV